jgi:hypothetical protein
MAGFDISGTETSGSTANVTGKFYSNLHHHHIEGPTSFADVSRNLFSTSNVPGYLAHQGPWLPWPP